MQLILIATLVTIVFGNSFESLNDQEYKWQQYDLPMNSEPEERAMPMGLPGLAGTALRYGSSMLKGGQNGGNSRRNGGRNSFSDNYEQDYRSESDDGYSDQEYGGHGRNSGYGRNGGYGHDGGYSRNSMYGQNGGYGHDGGYGTGPGGYGDNYESESDFGYPRGHNNFHRGGGRNGGHNRQSSFGEFDEYGGGGVQDHRNSGGFLGDHRRSGNFGNRRGRGHARRNNSRGSHQNNRNNHNGRNNH